jgi:hypothetical protein
MLGTRKRARQHEKGFVAAIVPERCPLGCTVATDPTNFLPVASPNASRANALNAVTERISSISVRPR